MNHGHGAMRRADHQAPLHQSKKRGIDAQEDAWVAEEDQFVLRQAKKKAAIRVRAGRAKPIDWLAVTLKALDTTKTGFDFDDADDEVEIVDPEGIFERLDRAELQELAKDIDTYMVLELDRQNKEYWQTMKVICKDKIEKLSAALPSARGVSSVNADVDRMLSPKTYEELEVLEKQIRSKLRSDEAIDVDYWEHLLRTLLVWKARAKLRKLSQAIIDRRFSALLDEQLQAAAVVRQRLLETNEGEHAVLAHSITSRDRDMVADPEPLLRLQPDDKLLEMMTEESFLEKISADRQKILKSGPIPLKETSVAPASLLKTSGGTAQSQSQDARFGFTASEDMSAAAYEREVARGINDNEEVFASEEQVSNDAQPKWADKYKPRKPKYFNRVQMGYEWNKYNQTHYDHDNPPPKVVQGYKFNIFYPDLIDPTKAPTYKIQREGGRKRGQSFAAAGEDDTCVIRFLAGPPYEDIAFRVVDKEWDYSAKRERGFRSSFERGVLQLHFQFKKVYYRK